MRRIAVLGVVVALKDVEVVAHIGMSMRIGDQKVPEDTELEHSRVAGYRWQWARVACSPPTALVHFSPLAALQLPLINLWASDACVDQGLEPLPSRILTGTLPSRILAGFSWPGY